MGIFDSIGNIVRGQLIDVIEWTDSTNNTIVHKYDCLLYTSPSPRD